MRIDHHHHFDPETLGLLRDMNCRLDNIAEGIVKMAGELKAAIADLATAMAANNTEIETLLSKIAAPNTTDAEVADAVTQIRSLISDNTAEISKAKAAAP